MDTEKKFADGIRFETPRPKAPHWIKGHIAVNMAKFAPWAEANQDERGWLNLDVKESKKGSLYVELDTYRRGGRQEAAAGKEEQAPAEPEVSPEDLPF